jgi:uncharacterized protein GlcG (DUF336 family)
MNITKSFYIFRRTQITAILIFLTLTLGNSPATISAENLPSETYLPLTLAIQAATAAMEKCKSDGYLVSVAVVGRSGRVKALVREDGAGPHTLNSSRKKAFTAASMGRPTSEFAQLITQMPAIQGLRDMDPNILILGGGLPIIMEGDVVGGIGVGGAPGGHLYDACAEVGLKSIGAAIKKPKKE